MMAIVLKNKKGFSMLEMLICMVMLSSLVLLTLNNTNSLNLDYCYFLNDYLYLQSEALLKRHDVTVDKGIYFNNMGHVNQAKTIDFTNHKVIIHLGSGYATKE